MASGDSEGLLWAALIGLGLWAYSGHNKMKAERTERIDAVADVDDRVSDLQARIIELERQVKFAEGDIQNVTSAHERLRKTFNGNVDLENRAKVERMTARGDCGTETVRFPDGGWTVRNKECTMKDLR